MRPVVFLTIVLLWWNGSLFADVSDHVDIASEDVTACRITKQSDTGLLLESTVSGLDFSEITTGNGSFITLAIPEYVNGPWENGYPQLPVLGMIIEIPQKAGVSVQVAGLEESQVSLDDLASGMPLAPSQPHRSKRISSDDLPFSYDDELYSTDQWIEPERASVEILGTLRTTRLARLTLCPFRYNPVSNQLGVAHRMTVQVTFESGDMALTRSVKTRYRSAEVDAALARVAFRLPSAPASKDTLIDSSPAFPSTYVVVASKAFLASSSLQDFILWKKRSGFYVTEVDTDSVYNSSTHPATRRTLLKNKLQDLYDSGPNPPAYILLVGDVSLIPAFQVSNIVIEGEAYADHYTDLYYCDFTGDYLPDAYYGRFPVRTEAELESVISKTLIYETYAMDADIYLDRAMLIAGADPYDSSTYANGQIAYLLNEYVNTDPANGFSEIYAFLFEPQSPLPWEMITWNWDGTTVNKTGRTLQTYNIKTYINQGLGFVNYTGHCDANGWYNKVAGDYELDVNDISSLTGGNLYGFYVANCCESSRFEQSDPVCFGSQMVLAENKGAVAYLGAANYTFWDDDFYWAVGYKSRIDNLPNYAVRDLSYSDTGVGNFDTLWHSHGEPRSQWHTTAGQMVYSGNLAVDTYDSNPSFDFGKYYWEIYNVLGDPSLMPYLARPRVLPEPDIEPIVPCQDTALRVNTVPYAQVALSRNDELLGSALADSEGLATLPVTPLDDYYELDLVITGQHYQPMTVTFVTDDFPPELESKAAFYYGPDEAAEMFDVIYEKNVTFINTSTGCPNDFAWEFEGADVLTSTDRNPTVTYLSLGTFPVRLTVENSNGSMSHIDKSVRVLPYVTFTTDLLEITTVSTVTFVPETSPEATAWFWTFSGGEPESSSEKAPQVRFPDVGNHPVTLSVIIGGEPRNPVTKSVFVVDLSTKSDPVKKSSGGGGCFIGSLGR